MSEKLLLSLIVALTCTDARWTEERIVGGTPVNITDLPYQLSVRLKGAHVCGGSLISARISISAAHCFQTPGPYSIKAGVTKLSESGVVVHVNRVIIHPNYDNNVNDYDIALMFLASALPLSDSIQPVKLPEGGVRTKLVKGARGTISGWGKTTHNSVKNSVDELREVEVVIWGWLECKSTYYSIVTERMFCAGSLRGGKDACQGDSGGPLVVSKVLYGIVSSGFDCGKARFPGIYTNVESLRGFIKEYANL